MIKSTHLGFSWGHQKIEKNIHVLLNNHLILVPRIITSYYQLSTNIKKNLVPYISLSSHPET